MHLKKYIFLLLLILLSGCTAKYNLNIDSNLIVSEELTLTESNNVLYTYTIDIDRYMEESTDEIVEKEGYDNYFFSSEIGDNKSSVRAKATYLDLENFKTINKVRNYFFTDLIYSEVSNVINLKFVVKNEIEVLKDSDLYNALIDKADITITLPFKVIENNANKVDETTNSYTWTYEKNKVNRDIELIFDTSKNANKPISKTTYIILGLIVVMLAIGLYVYYSYKKNSVL